ARRGIPRVSLDVCATLGNQVSISIQVEVAGTRVKLPHVILYNKKSLALNSDIEGIIGGLQASLREELSNSGHPGAQANFHGIAGLRSGGVQALSKNICEGNVGCLISDSVQVG